MTSITDIPSSLLAETSSIQDIKSQIGGETFTSIPKSLEESTLLFGEKN